MTWRFYFFTFGTYGRWLHGSEKGSHSHKKGRLAPNANLESSMRSELQSEPKTFNLYVLAWLFDEIFHYCLQHGLIIDALNVRTNHIHLVIATNRNLTRWSIIAGLKQYLSRRLHETGYVPPEFRVWERRYSCTSITNYPSWYRATQYTLFEQDSNYYMIQTAFARQNRLPFEHGEPLESALRNAFVSRSIHSFRKTILQSLDTLDPEEICHDELDLEPYATLA